MTSSDDLESQLLELTGRVRALEETAPDPAAIKSIHEKLDKLLDDRDAAPETFHWPDLPPDEAGKRWRDLLDWLYTVAIPRNYIDNIDFEPCWWRHADVVDGVTAVWLAWCAAYRSNTARATDPADWHRVHRFQLQEAARHSTMSRCRGGPERGHRPNEFRNSMLDTVPPDYTYVTPGQAPAPGAT